MLEKIEKLSAIYTAFEKETAGFREQAACSKGCAFCCSEAGCIDITTLEGLRIRQYMGSLSRPLQKRLQKALSRDVRKREAGEVVPCPFLQRNKACLIYPVRPFACRRIYSLHVCSADNPPLLSRQVMAFADRSVKELQQLDNIGYSGHLSYILVMLDAPRFLDTYLAGEWKPPDIMDFGKTHRIVINKTAAAL